MFDEEIKNRIVSECLAVLSSVKKPESGTIFADLGCGSGVFANILKNKVFRVIGLDLSHSQKGVTKNECPISAAEVEEVFLRHGFMVTIDYLSGLHYKTIASFLLRPLLALYNFLDAVIFGFKFMRKRRSFIITDRRKRGCRP